MKKYLPFILLGLGLLVLISAYFLVFRKSSKRTTEEKESLIEVPLSDRPVTSLTPDSSGHWLKLVIDKIKVKAETLDYELLYELPDGRTQGVPGTISLKDQNRIERDLLLGSESSGKFRYDEGVTQGSLTLRFRNEKGKLIAKFSTKFHLQKRSPELTSVDGKFRYKLNKKSPLSGFFVVMETFGVPTMPPGDIKAGPYGVFSIEKVNVDGTVELGEGVIYRSTSSGWEKLEDGKSTDIGIFIAASE